jgi:hypothetical protein
MRIGQLLHKLNAHGELGPATNVLELGNADGYDSC